jgi:AhpD family alkylhydroperoxidase
MTRKQVYEEIEQTFGLVPTMFKTIPDSSLEAEWQLYKQIELEEGPIPNKYRELIGLAIAGATRCRYCAFYHTEMARFFGATDEEIEGALHYAKFSTGWSTYVNGQQIDFDQFKDEILQACEHVRSTQPAATR